MDFGVFVFLGVLRSVNLNCPSSPQLGQNEARMTYGAFHSQAKHLITSPPYRGYLFGMRSSYSKCILLQLGHRLADRNYTSSVSNLVFIADRHYGIIQGFNQFIPV